MYLGQQLKEVLPSNVALGGANMGQVPLFQVQWWSQRSAIPAGYVAADGQELSSATFPDAKNGIDAGMVPTVANGTWISNPTERGKFVALSSTGKFRVPDYNGKFVGSLGAVFLRGDGTLSAAVAGVIQPDAFQGHKHSGGFAFGGTANLGNLAAYIQSVDTTIPISDGVNGTPRTSTETRPLNVTGCWIIKLFGALVNPGSADAAQLATDYAQLSAIVQGINLSKYYESDEQIITPGGSLTLNHGLSKEPKIITAYLKCISANLNYAVGDKVEVSTAVVVTGLDANTAGINVQFTDTQLLVRFGPRAGSTFIILDKSSGVLTNIVNANWKLILRAWA